jgi:acyl carrier protein
LLTGERMSIAPEGFNTTHRRLTSVQWTPLKAEMVVSANGNGHNGNGHNGNGHNGNGHKGNGSAHQQSDVRTIEQQPSPIRQSAAPEASPRPGASISATAVRALGSEAQPPQQPAPAPTPSAPPLTQRPTDLAQSLISIVSEKTGYPADMLDLSMDMEADLGIDSIKRVEILGAVQERHPALPKAEPQALAELRTLGQIVEHIQGLGQAQPQPKATASAVEARSLAVVPPPTSAPLDSAVLTQSLLAIVSEKTGYPADMLDLSMDMEADLGIDSIKRVEILGAVQERHPDLPKVEPQALAELRTLGQIVAYLQSEPDSKKV